MVTAETLNQYAWSAGETSSHIDEMSVRLPRDLVNQLMAFARANVPNECCGVGLGPAGSITEFHPIENVHETPRTRYEISAADQLRLFQRADARDWETTFVFHTHPETEPYPSATDVQLAGWPDAIYAIMGMGTAEPVLRAYRIRHGQIDECTVTVGSDPAIPVNSARIIQRRFP